MIRPLVESTLDSVSKALQDAGKTARRHGRDPAGRRLHAHAAGVAICSREQHRPASRGRTCIPISCVALGAGVLASRLAGRDVERVLVDVSPYSFGISYLGERGGYPYPHCYKPDHPPQHAAAGDAHREVHDQPSRTRPRWISRCIRATMRMR